MPAPSVEITIGDRGPASPAVGDVGSLFAIGVTEMGPVGSTSAVLSYNRWKSIYGDVRNDSHLARSVEAYFREGGTRVYTSRTVGPDAITADIDLSNTDPAVVVTFTASSPGDWAHVITFTVTAGVGDARTVVVENDGTVVLSGSFSDTESLVDALNALGLGTATEGPGDWPIAVLSETALAGGDDDAADITITEKESALAVFEDEELPVGTLTAPGDTTAATHAALLEHAKEYKRFALLDAIDTAVVNTLTAAASPLRALGSTAGYGQMLAPWEKVPGPGIGTVTIPPSGAQAGRMALTDRSNPKGPGQTAGGRFALSKWSVDVTQEWDKADRDTLSEAGVTVIRNIRGAVQMYDALTLADPDTWPQYQYANGVRVALAIYSQAKPALERRVLETIDGQGRLLSAIESDLVAICSPWYQVGALFGATAQDAFSVDTGPGVNPVEELAAGRVAAQMEIRSSPVARTISLLITKVAASDVI